MKKIFIAGCGGMLGEAFHEKFGSDYELMCTDKDLNDSWIWFLDFRNFDDYRNKVFGFKPDYLFHLGAFTNLEDCEKHLPETYENNTLGVENAVLIANELNIPLLYISTAGIFDGKKDCYDDWDIPNPSGVYARSKYMGERYVVENGNRYLVCRAGWMMGGGPRKDKKFVHKIMQQLKEGKKELFVVDDKNGTPTYTYDFASTVKQLIEHEFWGVYNCVCHGMTSRLEVAEEILKITGLTNDVKITCVNSEYFATEYFAERPASERLVSAKLELRGMSQMRNWRLALKEYIENTYDKYLK
jgi:dTDP-4-dehydrorhamnose reductase